MSALGYSRIDRTVDHAELWVRAVKGPDAAVVDRFGLPKQRPPYWFER